jgi:hypothetical protein
VLDHRLVPEASGLAVSRIDPARLYHVNDSGDGPFVYLSDLRGQGLRRVRLEGLARVLDVEALAVGRLNGEDTLFVGDIGDNNLSRPTIDVYAVAERAFDGETVPVLARLSLRYPDRPHNAEAMVAHPSGDLYILTKSWSARTNAPAPMRVYRAAAESWRTAGKGTATLELVGELDLPELARRERAPFSDVATDASLAADGRRLLVLTYGHAWEFAFDLAAGPPPPVDRLESGRDYQLIRLEPMFVKETIAYLPGARSFLFGKEYQPDRQPSRLVRLNCRD